MIELKTYRCNDKLHDVFKQKKVKDIFYVPILTMIA